MINKKNKIPFTNIQLINKHSINKKIILFGIGKIAEKTMRLLANSKISFFVDNASNLWGEKEMNIDVLSPDKIKDFNEKYYIIICTTSFEQVAEQLDSYGYNPIVNYSVSPILNDLRIINDLESISKTMLFTSGSPKNENKKYGGGIYKLDVKGDKWSYKKMISGNCYGLIKFGENFVSVDADIGVFEFDRNFKIIRSKKLPEGIRAHGIDYSTNHEKFYIVGSHIDGILVLDKNFNILNEILLSNKKKESGSPQHHCNDCLIVNDSLYVSMFSITGNWKNDVFDGGIIEFNLFTNDKVGSITNRLWMPHNIKYFDGSLHVLNSLSGELLTNNFKVIGKFPAFTRGLDYDGVFYYVGQSRNRNYSKNLGDSLNISIDAGIIVFDSLTKASRFLQLPPRVSEIHSILLF